MLRGKLTAIIDTSPVHGAGAVADTYELIRGFLRKVVGAAGARLDTAAGTVAQQFCDGKPDIDWQDPTARKAHLGELITAARRVLAAAAGIDDDSVAEPAGLLRQVIGQDGELDDDCHPQLRHGVASDRVISHSDPEMRHGRKSASRRFDGHKLDVMTDEASELILGVDVRAGNASDGDGAATLLDEVHDVEGVEIDTLIGDMAYSDGDVREAVEQAGAEMVAKVPPTSNAGRFPKTDFTIDTRAASVTCPPGTPPSTPVPPPITRSDQPPCSCSRRRPVRRVRSASSAPPPPLDALSSSAATMTASRPLAPRKPSLPPSTCCASV